ncbi:hypothetical protein BKE30_14635 [Alkanindiges hydrocarboniclasticus]|uniref:OmpA-like domain-containing protein n=2 Tax=Alkanindiges hydrocarboniclasticus TaxID=1907941 RepID=A0A1S8CQ85_9GAMM|nr:hypothetical protein BKE30_14635 [Alkanindiges hydrocarboniclasticus]
MAGCATKYQPPAQLIVQNIKNPYFGILKVHTDSDVATIQVTDQTVLCVSCAQSDGFGENDNVVWIKLALPKAFEPLTITDKHFDFDKAILKGDLSVLSKIVDRLQSDPVLTVDVVGHTDSKGSQKYNQKLGLKRSKAVANWLIRNGIAENRISISSMGENQPVATNKTKKGRALNRRAVISINIVD